MTAVFHRYGFQSWETTELVELLLSPDAREVLNSWLTDTRFLDDNLEPALLPLSEDGGTGLLNLVIRTGKGFAPARLLDELLNSGLVEQATMGFFLLRRSAYMPSPLGQQKGIEQDITPGRPGNPGNRSGYRTRHTDGEFWTTNEHT
ncbi:hypothetical protein [Marinobacter changyiensis]|uniref:hypothetical protein n=1 Tax=Marinobacter changyiensis TaxID=2604091 RepID=UPI00126518F7|nr:hypothetical protein [Marinobacter changyiensis]